MVVNQKRKRTYLAGVCLAILLALASIQAFLISKTYDLTRDSYFNEIKLKLISLNKNKAVANPIRHYLHMFGTTLDKYRDGEIIKDDLVKRFRDSAFLNKAKIDFQFRILQKNDSLLKRVSFWTNLEEVFITRGYETLTILSKKDRPIALVGKRTTIMHSSDILVSRDTVRQFITSDDPRTKHQLEYVYSYIKSDYADVGAWKQQVMLRMESIFLLTLILFSVIIGIVIYLLNAIRKEKQLVEMQTDFTNNINHELNTPLSSIAINLKNLKRDDIYQNRSAHNAQVSVLERQYLKLRHIVDQVLESEAGRLPEPVLRQLDIIAHIKEIINGTLLTDHHLKADISPASVIVSTDINIIEKVLDQLLENAVKYSEPGTEITLKTFRKGTWFCISVIDEGRGISVQHQKKIFDKFYRVPTKKAENVKGLGIGLYVGKLYLHQIGARLELQSQEGTGSTFTLKIPLT